MKHSPLVAIAFEKAPKKSKAKKSAEAAPTPYEAPSPAERTVERAHSSKVNATEDWINGKITGEKHKQIHKRADKVIRASGHVAPKPELSE